MISIVVPVFNNEQHLDNSIDSLINQTVFDQMEVVIVDDGSTDKSYEIIKDYAARYGNIKAIHQENGGVSAARNTGIKACSGDYVAFFDSDDLVEPEMYEELLNLMEKYEADISIVDFSGIFEDGSKVKHRDGCIKTWDDPIEIMKSFFKRDYIGINVFDKLFRNELIRGIEFPEGYTIGEDMFFMYSVLRRTKRIVLDSNKSLYNYMIREGSAMKRSFNEKYCDTVKLSLRVMELEKNNAEIFPYAKANYIHEICKTLRILYDSNEEQDFKEIEESYLNEIYGYRLIDGVRYMNGKHFLAQALMKASPKLYGIVYKIMKLG